MRIRLTILAVTLLMLSPSAASSACLSRTEQLAAISEGRSVSLAKAKRAVRGRSGAEVVDAKLCESSKGLHYRLTLLGRDGKVMRATVDAATGTLLSIK